MPYLTREMVEYMHKKGMTNNGGKVPRHSSEVTNASSKKRIRERPISSEASPPESNKGGNSSHRSVEPLPSAPAPATSPEMIGSRANTLFPSHDALFGSLPKKGPSKTTKLALEEQAVLIMPTQQTLTRHKTSASNNTFNSHSPDTKMAFSSSSFSSTVSSSKTSPSNHKTSLGIRRKSSGQSSSSSSSTHKSFSSKKSKGSQQRVLNHKVNHKSASLGSKHSPEKSGNKHSPEMSRSSKVDFDKGKLKFIQMLISSNVQQFNKTTPASENGEKELKAYSFDETKPFGSGKVKPHSCTSMHEAINKEGDKENRILVKIYASASSNNQQQSLPPENYFKMLRHFGRKHPFIVTTYEVFSIPNKYNKLKATFYVFQEMAPGRNALVYTKEHGPLTEIAVASVARQLRQAMDFIGDMGVCHRAISPWHLLIFNSTETTFSIKLTGFRSAIIYYDDKENDIHYQACVPLPAKRGVNTNPGKLPEFQAPETYGDPATEEFDPICADVWSFSATLYYLLCCKYPYHFFVGTEQKKKMSPTTFNCLEDEIQQNVLKLKKVSSAGQSLLRHGLTTVSVARTTIDRLKDHPFIVQSVPHLVPTPVHPHSH